VIEPGLTLDTASGVLKLLCWQFQKFDIDMLGQPCQASDDHRTVKQEVSTPRLKKRPTFGLL